MQATEPPGVISAPTAALRADVNCRTSHQARQAHLWLLASGLIIYVLLAFSLARVKTPWVDEGWFGSAPANWARTGQTGTLSLEPTGSWLSAELTGINERTYWILPVSMFAQGVWYKVFGFSLLTMRSLGIALGFLCLLSWYAIIGKLAGSRLAGSLTAAILAIDYTFLWSAADGRMDMMCETFGAAGIASYLLLREKHWRLGLWIANVSIALAVFTHPNGLIFFLSVAFLVFYYDRDRVSWRDWVVVTPYLVLAVAWGFYVSDRPDYFLAQFSANSGARGGVRWEGFIHPIRAVAREIVLRYLRHYGLMVLWGGPVPNYAILIPFLYWAAALGCIVTARFRKNRGLTALFVIAALHLALMTWFIGHKSESYLVFALPLYAGLVAVWLCTSYTRAIPKPVLATVVTAVLVLCQVGTIAFKIRKNAYASEYVPTVQFVREKLAANGGNLVADSYFGFDLGFQNVIDDARLGYYSGAIPYLIVEDMWYEIWWDHLFLADEPQVDAYVRHLLDSEYTVVFNRGPFRVYERKHTGS